LRQDVVRFVCHFNPADHFMLNSTWAGMLSYPPRFLSQQSMGRFSRSIAQAKKYVCGDIEQTQSS
jgi:hypothetical protein